MQSDLSKPDYAVMTQSSFTYSVAFPPVWASQWWQSNDYGANVGLYIQPFDTTVLFAVVPVGPEPFWVTLVDPKEPSTFLVEKGAGLDRTQSALLAAEFSAVAYDVFKIASPEEAAKARFYFSKIAQNDFTKALLSEPFADRPGYAPLIVASASKRQDLYR